MEFIGGVTLTRYILLIVIMPEKKTKFKLRKKVTKYNLRIISKPHARLQTMTKRYVKFQKNQYKTVGGVAHTRYPLSIHLNGKNA